jgi:hypothetical protein
MNTRIVTVSIVPLGLSAVATAQAQAPQVTLVSLPAPSGGSGVALVDMNAAGGPYDDHRNFELGAFDLDGWGPQRNSGIPSFYDFGFEHVTGV